MRRLIVLSSSRVTREPCRVPDMCVLSVSATCVREVRPDAIGRTGPGSFMINACGRNTITHARARTAEAATQHGTAAAQSAQRTHSQRAHPVLSIGTSQRGTSDLSTGAAISSDLAASDLRKGSPPAPRISPLHRRAIASQRRPFARTIFCVLARPSPRLGPSSAFRPRQPHLAPRPVSLHGPQPPLPPHSQKRLSPCFHQTGACRAIRAPWRQP